MNSQIAPAAPGQLGQPVDVLQLRSYLIALDGWLDGRRAELEALDEAVRTSDNADELTSDIALGLQLWQAIQARYRRLLQVWDRGRVGQKERDQLSSLIWGRLDDEVWGGASLSGVSLPEACRMSDALTGQLRSRLQLDPAGTQAVGRLRDLRASMERLRDQVALEPPQTIGQARQHLGGLEERLDAISEKAGRGGDIGGLLGPLEADAARFERDLIVGGVLRRRQPATAAEQPTAPGAAATDQQREQATRLRADLVGRGQQLSELVARVAQMVANPPKYAVPDVTALGPVPEDPAEVTGYLERLQRVAKAMDMVEHANSQALHSGEVLANELIMLRNEIAHQGVRDDKLDKMLALADDLVASHPRPDEALDPLLSACRHYANWLVARRDVQGSDR